MALRERRTQLRSRGRHLRQERWKVEGLGRGQEAPQEEEEAQEEEAQEEEAQEEEEEEYVDTPLALDSLRASPMSLTVNRHTPPHPRHLKFEI